MADPIPVSQHPSNLDETAVIVGSIQSPDVVFRVRGGFMPVNRGGYTLPGLFRSEAEARAAMPAAAE